MTNSLQLKVQEINDFKENGKVSNGYSYSFRGGIQEINDGLASILFKPICPFKSNQMQA
jgi:hypothetical protein